MEEDPNSEELEVTPQDHESTSDVEDIAEETIEDTPQIEEDPQERNFRNLRKKAEQAELEARQYKEKMQLQDEFIKNLMSQNNHQMPAQSKNDVDPFDEIPDNEYLPKGQSRQMFSQDARKIAREEFQAYEREREKLRFKERLKSKYSDFDDVVNAETIAILEQKEPELANTIADLQDPYKMGLQTYNFIKAMNIGGSSDERRHAKEVKKKIEKNEKNVQSPQVYNKRPMAQAFSIANMNADEQKQLYEEMMGYANQSPGY